MTWSSVAAHCAAPRLHDGTAVPFKHFVSLGRHAQLLELVAQQTPPLGASQDVAVPVLLPREHEQYVPVPQPKCWQLHWPLEGQSVLAQHSALGTESVEQRVGLPPPLELKQLHPLLSVLQ